MDPTRLSASFLRTRERICRRCIGKHALIHFSLAAILSLDRMQGRKLGHSCLLSNDIRVGLRETTQSSIVSTCLTCVTHAVASCPSGTGLQIRCNAYTVGCSGHNHAVTTMPGTYRCQHHISINPMRVVASPPWCVSSACLLLIAVAIGSRIQCWSPRRHLRNTDKLLPSVHQYRCISHQFTTQARGRIVAILKTRCFKVFDYTFAFTPFGAQASWGSSTTGMHASWFRWLKQPEISC